MPITDAPDPNAPNDVLGVWPAPKHLHDEVRDAAWADFGRMVSKNIFDPDFLEVLTRAGLKSKTTAEMLGYIRAFILTGAKP